ncbi:hypothetical protein IAU60_003121 [Kwoniella sp. DSM 27419]
MPTSRVVSNLNPFDDPLDGTVDDPANDPAATEMGTSRGDIPSSYPDPGANGPPPTQNEVDSALQSVRDGDSAPMTALIQRLQRSRLNRGVAFGAACAINVVLGGLLIASESENRQQQAVSASYLEELVKLQGLLAECTGTSEHDPRREATIDTTSTMLAITRSTVERTDQGSSESRGRLA